MNLVVDTSVWSLVLRRRRVETADPHVVAFTSHVEAGDGVFLVGPILQELLDGLYSTRDRERMLSALEPFPMLPLDRQTFILAAEISTACRTRGIRAGSVDFQIAAACVENGFPLLSADQDFVRIAACSNLGLVSI